MLRAHNLLVASAEWWLRELGSQAVFGRVLVAEF
jgi:hypothetical protein